MEAVFTILIFLAVISITALIFGGWVVVMMLRGVGRLLSGGLHPHEERWIGQGQAVVTCPRSKCRTVNPAEARFCRRCGQSLPAAQRVSVRRAAML